MSRIRATLVATAAAAAALLAPLAAAPAASAHGWITSPESRQGFCAEGATSFDCGEIKYEPQSVEAPKGSTKCSGGSSYTILDDNSKPWPRTTTGTTVTFQWKLTAAHSTASWEYFLDGVLYRTFDGGNKQPPSNVSQTIEGLPTGDHTMLVRWNIADTANAFYSCVDLHVVAGGTDPGDGGTTTPPVTTSPTDPTTPTTPTNPGTCSAAAWSSSSVYLGGDQASYNGQIYRANWWTQGDTPSNTAWGPWTLVGSC